jgi:hypothetical protein
MKTESKQRIIAIANELFELNSLLNSKAMKPVEYSDKRLVLIREGLQCLADGYDFPAMIGHADSLGEFMFSGNKGNRDAECKPFGAELATWLNHVYTRCGMDAKRGTNTARSGWTRINHFNAQNLIGIIAQKSQG